MLFFKKKEPEALGTAGKGFVPIERVKDLSTKGFSEPEMIDVLRKEGFAPEEIDKALTEALKTGAVGTPQSSAPALPTLEQLQSQTQPQQQQMPQIPETSLPQEYYQQQYPTEEYIEYVVRARTADMDEKMNEFTVRYGELEKRMAEINEQLNNLAKARTSGEQLIISKIDSSKDLMTDVDTRLSSLEKAFKETLPALIEAVRTLSDLVQRVKREA
jgi:DNA-binding transcriptional MerR regulator